MNERVSITAGDDHCFDTCISEYAEQILSQALDGDGPAMLLCRRRLHAALDYHRGRFESAWDRPVGDEELVSHLRCGEFAVGRRDGYDLVGDVIMAALLEAQVDGAARAFDRRFRPQIDQWAGRFAAADPEVADDLIADLLLPRQTSGPRIGTYKGQGPLDGWLKQVLISQVHRRRRHRGPVLTADGTRAADEPGLSALTKVRSTDPTEEYARRECTEKLAPAFAGMFDILDEAHRTVLFMAVVDGVEQKKIAALFGVPAYKITRMKQSAIEKVARGFYTYARTTLRMGGGAVRDCLRLILERFPSAELENLLTLAAPGGEDRNA